MRILHRSLTAKRKNSLFTVRLQAKWDNSPLPESAVRYSTTMKIISQAAHTLTPKETARRQQHQAHTPKETVQLQAAHTHTQKGEKQLLQGRVRTLKERKPQQAVIAATQKETVLSQTADTATQKGIMPLQAVGTATQAVLTAKRKRKHPSLTASMQYPIIEAVRLSASATKPKTHFLLSETARLKEITKAMHWCLTMAGICGWQVV